jgi:PBP1b-binding outer membrane lipoprotein LpoB
MFRFLMVTVLALTLAGCMGCKTSEKYETEEPLTDTNGVVVPPPSYEVAK